MPCLVHRLPAAGCWGLVSLQDPRGCRASAGSLVSRAKVQKTGAGACPLVMGFMPGPRVGPQISSRLLAGKARSWSQAAEPRDPRAGVSGGWGCGSWHSWVCGVPKLVLTCWWAGPGPSLSQGMVWLAVGRLGPLAARLWFWVWGLVPLSPTSPYTTCPL